MKESILLVDDEEGIRKVLSIALADMGYQVLTAVNGLDAMKVFEKNAPTIVLTDIKMPEMDGIGLLRWIKQRRPDTEVIMISGHGDLDLAIKSVKYEATDFVTKPINDDTLEIALARAQERLAMRRKLQAYTQNLEALVREKSKQLIEAERLAAVGATVAGLSHAIKNIAGGLKGGAFVLEKGIQLKQQQYLMQGWEMIKGNVEKITRLSLDLLNYAKGDDLNLKRCDPNTPAREVADLMAGRARDCGVALDLDLSPDVAAVELDPDLIHRCLLNLVTNGIDACMQPRSGKAEKRVTIRTRVADGWGVEYEIVDTGAGMSAEIKADIFRGFFTTKGSEGTGIGLMITKKIVDAHRGEIDVASQEGRGSTFRVRLPDTR